jgi:hypothetical protein
MALSDVSVARLEDASDLRLMAADPIPKFVVLHGHVLVEVMEDFSDHPPSVSMGAYTATLSNSGLYYFDAASPTIGVYGGKLRIESQGGHWTIRRGSALRLGPTVAKIGFDRGSFRHSELFAWSRDRSRLLAKASWPTAKQVLQLGPSHWHGAGWYWNSILASYCYLPSGGDVEDVFGFYYFSPYMEYAPRRPGLAQGSARPGAIRTNNAVCTQEFRGLFAPLCKLDSALNGAHWNQFTKSDPLNGREVRPHRLARPRSWRVWTKYSALR